MWKAARRRRNLWLLYYYGSDASSVEFFRRGIYKVYTAGIRLLGKLVRRPWYIGFSLMGTESRKRVSEIEQPPPASWSILVESFRLWIVRVLEDSTRVVIMVVETIRKPIVDCVQNNTVWSTGKYPSIVLWTFWKTTRKASHRSRPALFLSRYVKRPNYDTSKQ